MDRTAAALLLRQASLGVSGVACVGLLLACTALDAAPSSTPGGSGDIGYLEGQVTIGPLRPVERVGVPPPTPPPELCTSLGFIVASADGAAEVARFSPGPECSYRVALRSGVYVVRLATGGLRRTKNLPATVQITGGRTTRLDVRIDTGIR
jgi:hypothetical protein